MKRIAVVTGGTRGIGAAISKELHARNYLVVAVYAGNQEAAHAFEKETGIVTMRWDVSDFSACKEGLEQVEQKFGPISILVNNAGITRDGMFHKMTYQQWLEVINVNLNSVFAMTRPVIEGMRARGFGRIINISSVNGQKGQMGQANYCAAKAGLVGFSKALALENASKGITVNCICPGYVDTDMVAAVDERVMAKIIGQIPVGRLGQAAEVAQAVCYLASDENGFMTGATLSMNGGQYMV